MSVCVPLPDMESLPPGIKEAVESLPLNVFRMAANAPASFVALAGLARSILSESLFDPRKREIAVLRVARVTNANYEWTHHVAVAKQCGVTDDEIETIKAEDPVSSLGEEENLLCRVADEISLEVRLSDEALSQILDRYGVGGHGTHPVRELLQHGQPLSRIHPGSPGKRRGAEETSQYVILTSTGREMQ